MRRHNNPKLSPYISRNKAEYGSMSKLNSFVNVNKGPAHESVANVIVEFIKDYDKFRFLDFSVEPAYTSITQGNHYHELVTINAIVVKSGSAYSLITRTGYIIMFENEVRLVCDPLSIDAFIPYADPNLFDAIESFAMRIKNGRQDEQYNTGVGGAVRRTIKLCGKWFNV